MKQKSNLYNWLIGTFIVLYILTATISFFHAVQFFNIGNVVWMSYILALAFEASQCAILFSILMTDNKKTLVPWIAMFVVTSIQCIGNVYSVFKYMSLNSMDYYVYLQKPLLFMSPNISSEMVMIIIAWIIGALLPIIALLLTSMVANNIQLKNNKTNDITSSKDENLNEPIQFKEPVILKENTIWDDSELIKRKNIKSKPKKRGRPRKIKKPDNDVKDDNIESNIKTNNSPQIVTMNNGAEYVPKLINNEEVLVKK